MESPEARDPFHAGVATPDITARIAECVALGRSGDPATARQQLEALWEEAGYADAATRCGIAHALADVQDEVEAELAWDLRSLACAMEATDDDVASIGMDIPRAGLLPSVYLNVADACRRLGLSEMGRGAAREGLVALSAVESDPYFAMIRSALERVVAQLDEDDVGDHLRGP